MSKQPPFEELDERWSDLPLPDADAAWRDMSALLDKDDRKAPPIVPAFLSGCAGWALLLLVVVVGAAGLYWYESKSESPVPSAASPKSQPGNGPDAVPAISADSDAGNSHSPNPGATADGTAASSTTNPAVTDPNTAVATKGTQNQQGATVPDTLPGTTPVSAPPSAVAAAGSRSPLARRKKGNPIVSGVILSDKFPRKPFPGNKTQNKGETTGAPIAAAAKHPGAPATRSKEVVPKAAPIDGSASADRNPASSPDKEPIVPANADGTAKLAAADSNSREKPLAPPPAYSPQGYFPAFVKAKEDSLAGAAHAEAIRKRARRAPWLSAGVGISQAVPIGGQQGSAPNYQGRFNPLSEHVPAVWLRLHKGRWFLQGEARFNAPQLLPAFAFAQKTRLDTATHSLLTERQQLRKAWYHQFPLTANYQVLPRWSIGAGLQWSVLYRASGERLSYRRDLASNFSFESSTPFQVPGYRDSFLYKSQWQLVLQTEASWRRWGLGLRYRSDLEPYLRYTRPEGEVVDVKNDAFEATIRFRLWQSRKRR